MWMQSAWITFADSPLHGMCLQARLRLNLDNGSRVREPVFSKQYSKNWADCHRLLLARRGVGWLFLLGLSATAISSREWSRGEVSQPFQINQQLIPLLWFAPGRVRRIGVREELQKIGTEFGGDSREILLRKPFEQLGADVVVHEIASRRRISIRI